MNDWDIPFRNPKITLIKTNIGAMAKLKGDNFVKYISQTDALFLSLCDGTRTIKEITNKLADIYKVNSTKVLDDIKKLIGNSLTKNFISLIPVKMQKRLDYFENWKEFIFVPEKTKMIIPALISSMSFSLTNYCPYNCNYCFGKFNSKKDAFFLPKDIVINAIDEVLSLGSLENVVLTGGDPIVYPDLAEIIAYLKSKMILCEVSTKGLLLKEDKVKELSKAGLKRIQISIDSWDSKKWSKLVGIEEKYFSSVIRAFACCYNYNIKTRARITMTNENSDGILKLIKNLYSMGVNDFRIVCLIPSGRASINNMPKKEQIEKLKFDITEFLKIVKYPPKIIFGTHVYNNKISCGGGRFSLHVSSNGDVLLCDVVEGIDKERFTLGNIKNTSLKEIWFSKELNKFRLRNNIESCSKCERLSECNGGCYAFSYAYSGIFNSPDPRCSKLFGKENELFVFNYLKGV